MRRVVGSLLCSASLAAALLVTIPLPARAAEKATYRLVEISLWPEYDRPQMLVILRAVLAEHVTPPIQLELPLPAGVVPSAVAYRDADGTLRNLDHTRSVRGEVGLVQARTDRREVRLEYYAPLARQGPQRSYTLVWPGGMDIARFDVEVLPPPGVDTLQLTPAATRQVTDRQGRTHHLLALGPRMADEPFKLELRYDKNDDRLTAGPVKPATPPTPPTSPSAPAPVDEPSPAPTPATAVPEASASSDGVDWPVIFVVGIFVVAALAFILIRPRPSGGKKQDTA